MVDAFELAKAEAMLTGYDTRWGGEAYEVLAVEVPFQTELRNPTSGRPSKTWRLAGKLDGVVREVATGRVLVMEHKTAGEDISPGSEYWRRLRMDGQVSVYYEGATSLGFDVSACLYDVLKKPALRPLKATAEEARKYTKAGVLYAGQRLEDETPEEYRARLMEAIAEAPAYFQRGDVVRLEAEMGEALFDVWQTGQSIHKANKAERHPRNPDACSRYGRTCAFFDVCTGTASLGDASRFTQGPVHPELGPEVGDNLLTSSRLKDARACPRLHHYRYGLGYRPAEDAEALRFGTLLHRGLEAWWSAPSKSRLSAALSAVREVSP